MDKERRENEQWSSSDSENKVKNGIMYDIELKALIDKVFANEKDKSENFALQKDEEAPNTAARKLSQMLVRLKTHKFKKPTNVANETEDNLTLAENM
jgi:hypothetical protein